MSIDFQKPSLAQIEALIQKELKDKPIESLLVQKAQDLAVKPIYTAIGGNAVQVSPFLTYRVNFQYVLCDTADLFSINDMIIHALENGASGLIIDFHDRDFSLEDLSVLFRNVGLEFVHTEFLRVKSIEIVHQFLDSYPKPLDGLQIALEKSDRFSSILTISDDNFIENAGKMIKNIENNQFSAFIHIELSGDYFWDIAKIRAFKVLFGNFLKKSNHTAQFLIIGETPIANKSSENEANDLIKLTTEAMSAMLASCDGLWIKPLHFQDIKDNQFSQRMSRNIFNLLTEESYLNYVDDPAHGSYFIENYTRQIAEKIYKYL